MKKIKRLSALLMAAAITTGTVSSISAGAYLEYMDKEKMDEIIENSYKIPVDSFFSWGKLNEYYANDRLYLVETEEDNLYELYSIYRSSPDKISAEFNSDIDDDTIKKAVAEIYPDAEYIKISQSESESLKTISIAAVDPTKMPNENVYEDLRKIDITYEQVCEIYNMLNDTCELKNFKYTKSAVYPRITTTPLTRYSSRTNDVDNLELVENYIIENNLDWYIGKKDDGEPYYTAGTFTITPKNEISAEECFKFMEQIYNDLGLQPSIRFPEDSNSSKDSTIEMHVNVKGDANNDGEVNLADAVKIMQATCNSSRGYLSAQGAYNADVTGNGDGITNKDALAIQMYKLGLIDSFE